MAGVGAGREARAWQGGSSSGRVRAAHAAHLVGQGRAARAAPPSSRVAPCPAWPVHQLPWALSPSLPAPATTPQTAAGLPPDCRRTARPPPPPHQADDRLAACVEQVVHAARQLQRKAQRGGVKHLVGACRAGAPGGGVLAGWAGGAGGARSALASHPPTPCAPRAALPDPFQGIPCPPPPAAPPLHTSCNPALRPLHTPGPAPTS